MFDMEKTTFVVDGYVRECTEGYKSFEFYTNDFESLPLLIDSLKRRYDETHYKVTLQYGNSTLFESESYDLVREAMD